MASPGAPLAPEKMRFFRLRRSAGGLEWQLDPREIPSSHLERLTQTAGAAPCPTDGVQMWRKNKNLPTDGEFRLTFTPHRLS